MKIVPHLKRIIEIISNEESIQIEAPTGTGKSIMIPYELVKELNYRVFISVPKVTSAVMISDFAQRLHPNTRTGYGAKGVVKYNDDTQVVYATSGHMRNKILDYASNGVVKDINFCDVLVIDEMHTGSVDNEVIIDLLLEAKKQGRNVPKVLFLSATPVENNYTPKPYIYRIDIEHTYPVDLQYVPPISSSESDIYSKAVSIAASLPKEDGNILIFAHGKKAIFAMANTLRSTNKDDLILPVYSGLSDKELEDLYTSTNKRKIIIATNIVESSITLDDLGVVIDTLLENIAYTSPAGCLMLVVDNISKDSAEQRLGRVGRTRRGKCFRVISASDYSLFKEHPIPETHRVPINEVVMDIISSGLDPVTILRNISETKIRQSLTLLKEIGAVNDIGITKVGRFISTLPIGVRNGVFLYHWIEQGLPIYPGVVIASIIEGYRSPGYFHIPTRNKDESRADHVGRVKKFYDKIKPYKGTTQIHTYLKLWDSFTKNYPEDRYKIIADGTLTDDNLSKFRGWCSDNSVNQKKFLELLYIVRRIYTHVLNGKHELLGHTGVTYFDPVDMADQSVDLMTKIYANRVLTRSSGYMYLDDSFKTYVLETRNILSEMEEGDYPDEIHALSAVEIKGRVLVSLAIPAISR